MPKLKSIADFSVLISVYHRETRNNFIACMNSIWHKQALKPNQVVLVKDGPLPESLTEEIGVWENEMQNALTIVTLKQNVGLGKALQTGLEHCKYDIVARMDSDDISSPDRFLLQIEALKTENLDVCSSWVSEFNSDPRTHTGIRKVPSRNTEIVRFSKGRNPINHPAVVYRKSKVIEAGGYRDMPAFEDYYLWMRMIDCGATFGNIQKPLVNMRAGDQQILRRIGTTYALNEARFALTLLRERHISVLDFVTKFLPRIAIRLLPRKLISTIYQKLRQHAHFAK